MHSAKAAELLNLNKLVDHSLFVKRQLEFLLYGKVKEKIPVRIYTDSEPTLESIASTKQIETKMLRQYVEELKETLTMKQVESYGWLCSQDMVADGLTKEMKLAVYLSDLFLSNILHNYRAQENMIKLNDEEIRMFNIRSRTENKLSRSENKLCAEFGSSQAEKVQATF